MRILIYLLFSIVAVDFTAAGCKMNLRIKNETKKYAVKAYSMEVKTRAVPWRDAEKGGWDFKWSASQIARYGPNEEELKEYEAKGSKPPRYADEKVIGPGRTGVGKYEAVLGCGVKRRYRFDVICREVEPDPQHPDSENRFIWKGGLKGVSSNLSPEIRKTRYFPGPKQWAEGRNVTIPIKNCK